MTRLRPLLLLAGVAALILAPIGQGNYIVYTLCSWLLFSIAAMGLNLTLGYAGQVSLAQAGFMGIGAYITALMTLAGMHWGVAVIASILSSFAVGLLLGYPALRVQHHFLAFVTLAFNTLLFLVLRNEEDITGGSFGLSGMERPSFFGFSTDSNLAFYYFSLVCFLIAAFSMWWILRSPWGRAFKALRENPIRAESLGLKVRRQTLLAFAIGSAFGGLAGALQSPLVQFIEPSSFALMHSLKLLLMVVVGGAGFFFGPMLGAAVVILLPEVLRFTEGYYLIIYAFLVIVLMVYSPNGLIGLGQKLYEKLKPKHEARRDLKQGVQL
ncbi:branched-chain amino acid ABC transporter permease [Shinella sumterensis]|uniref:Branched-chain amino acid ABC transporter permease n=1 Tax=Shinella sumterensis TaxID=1967501 RepID=A0AA50HHK2_9HYPH|nr:branched-chain amino acid ABC transporter permease [Shinella sumterensis]MDP9591527.1 branched-chain amino acid transport system permease protein [Shinella zoogloeoides]MCD1262831.1 branched-chain amino acid ABC transporter permease [Shinella sumterensis]TFE94782.1 branched-chain amino acid ABC transporter permease [Shinella sumterensis]WLR97467.1 branched-chain amino acid ABC transporter permease [Shinella sumterensis]WLS07237.1 branched-chain amino acid ABC transporter permease [Shinella 